MLDQPSAQGKGCGVIDTGPIQPLTRVRVAAEYRKHSVKTVKIKVQKKAPPRI